MGKVTARKFRTWLATTASPPRDEFIFRANNEENANRLVAAWNTSKRYTGELAYTCQEIFEEDLALSSAEWRDVEIYRELGIWISWDVDASGVSMPREASWVPARHRGRAVLAHNYQTGYPVHYEAEFRNLAWAGGQILDSLAGIGPTGDEE